MHRRFKPKPLSEQTIVISGAANGIGSAVAHLVAQKGSNIVLASSKDKSLELMKRDLLLQGCNILVVETDESFQKLSEEAIVEFGLIDTWINCGYFYQEEQLLHGDLSLERKIFEINFWDYRVACMTAVQAMKKSGGVIINLGGEIHQPSQPLSGIYSASKSSLRTFTDALRTEIRHENLPIELCLVRPGRLIDESAFAPIAETILKCCEFPRRDYFVGGPARLAAVLDTFFPNINDMMIESRLKELEKENFRRF